MRIAVFVVAASMMVVGSAWPQVQTHVDVRPDWKKKPTADELLSVWPKAAMKSGLVGKALIHCKVSRQGALYDCLVVSESPAGAGFGGAALVLTPQLLMTPALKDGQPVEFDGVTIPINFDGRNMAGMALATRQSIASIGRWTAAPTYGEVVAAYPAKARAGRISGHSSMSCTIRGDGRLASCEKLSTAPEGLGFADAARKLTAYFQAPLTLQDGTSTRGMAVQLPFTFAPEMLDATEPVVGKPKWVAVPSIEQMGVLLPTVSGPAQTVRVTMICRVTAGGKVDDCKVESETPQGQGYGAIAIKMSGAFELSTWTAEGLPTVGGRVTIPVRFEVGGAEPAVNP